MAQKRLGYLYRLSLLNRPQFGTNRFVFHPLIRSFAKDLATERGLLAAAEAHHADYYIKLVRSSDLDDPSVAAFVAGELDDIVLAAEWLQRQDIADDEIAYRLQPFFQRAGYWQKAIQLIAGFLAVAERTKDWRAIAQLRIQQAKYLSLRGDLTGAEKILSPLADIISRIEAQKVRQPCETMWLTTLGTIHQRRGHFDEAVKAFQQSAAIEEQLGSEHGRAKMLNSLGAVLQRMGRFDEALDVFQRSYELLVKLDDQRGQAMVLNSLGGVLQRQGKFEAAMGALERSYAISEQMGDQISLAMVHFVIGKTLLAQGKVAEAVTELSQSFEINLDLKHKQGIGIVTPKLVQTLIQSGKPDEASGYYQRAIALIPNDKRLLQLRTHLSPRRQPVGNSSIVCGRIKCVIPSPKGYRFGFVIPDSGAADIYFHQKDIDPDCFAKLAAGVRVEAEVMQETKGLRAIALKLID
jgi:tetratricopeptide (TPR) repeat protein